jgi:hypothetical protein
MYTAISEHSPERTLSFSNEFEDCVHLLSLEELSQNYLLIRFEYIYEINETKSKSIAIELNRLFTNFKVVEAIETSRTGIESITEVKARKLKWNCEECNDAYEVVDNYEKSYKYFTIIDILYPKEYELF